MRRRWRDGRKEGNYEQTGTADGPVWYVALLPYIWMTDCLPGEEAIGSGNNQGVELLVRAA